MVKFLEFRVPSKIDRIKALGQAFIKLEGHGYYDPETGRAVQFDPIIGAAIKMLLFTGARKSEILTLKWEYIDYGRNVAKLPDSKTGAKEIPLNSIALAVLAELPRINEYCFPGRFGKGHVVNIKDTWYRLLKTAGLTGYRIHDIRHTFASYGVCMGTSLPIVGAILGHTQAATTERYAHLADNPKMRASEEIGAHIAQDFSGGKLKRFVPAAG